MTAMRCAGIRPLSGLLLAVTGCSFLFVHGPPSPPLDREPVDCTRSNVAPVIDLAVGLVALAGGIGGLTADSSCNPRESFCLDLSGAARAGGATLLGVGGLFMTSSVSGFAKTHSCRELVDARRACREGSAEACARLVATPTPR